MLEIEHADALNGVYSGSVSGPFYQLDALLDERVVIREAGHQSWSFPGRLNKVSSQEIGSLE